MPAGDVNVDDAWLGAYLASKRIPKLVVRYEAGRRLGADQVWNDIWRQHGLHADSNPLHLEGDFLRWNLDVVRAVPRAIWDREIVVRPRGLDLSREEQRLRERVAPFLAHALELLGPGPRTVVEIGSMRHAMDHDLAITTRDCCVDGHSTVYFGRAGHRVFSVDADPEATRTTGRACQGLDVHAVTADGVAFLEAFEETIDLLYLDAWDVVDGTPYAEEHLRAFEAAAPKLDPRRHLVVVDDTDFPGLGKGRLLVPRLLEMGYTRAMSGRQTILVRDATYLPAARRRSSAALTTAR